MKPNARPKNAPQPSAQEEIPNIHWADHIAEELIAKHPKKETLVCASGISPSGTVHIGNFREVITSEFVVRALKERGRQVRFLWSWDDYDALRKVPVNLPEQKMIEENLRRPISSVPDPFGKSKSYAKHFEEVFEHDSVQLGVKPNFIYQHQAYESCKYADGILHAVKHEKEIAAILNKWRTEPLPDDWTCLSIFCKECYRDTTKLVRFEEPSTFIYTCKVCKKENSVDCRREKGVKLLWRVDWPMRWAHEGVDFEPGGKDHSSQGGSYETGAEIIRTVWKKEPPHYQQYDFVMAKGKGAKLSSSSGQLITLGEALEIYEPAVIRWIFASRKPNIDFSIAFDLDVMKAYDDFDRCERFAFGMEPGEPKKANYEKRVYQFSVVDPDVDFSAKLVQFPFRHLCNILQIYQGDIQRAKNYYTSSLKTESDHRRFEARAERAMNWIQNYAPVEFKFTLRDPSASVTSKFPEPMKAVIELLKSGGTDGKTEDEVANQIYQIMKSHSVEPKLFFQDVYNVLIGKPNGPKLASFLIAMGPQKAVEILQKSV